MAERRTKGSRNRAKEIESTIERTRRFQRIYREWRGGRDPDRIASKHGISARRVMQIVDGMRTMGYGERRVTPYVSLVRVDRHLDQLEQAVTDAAELRDRANEEGNLQVALGAQARLAKARQELLELQQKRGLIPRKMTDLQIVADGVSFANDVIRVLDRHDVPERVLDEIAETVEARLTGEQGARWLDFGTEEGEVIDSEVVGLLEEGVPPEEEDTDAAA